MAAMRVGVNLLWCRPGRVGGSEEYLVRQLDGLAAVAPDVAARLLVPPGFTSAHPQLADHFEIVTTNTAVRFRGGRLIAEPLAVRRLLGGTDVIHHAGGTMPPDRGRRHTLLTIHDVQYLRYPRYFSTARRAYLRRRVPQSVDRATAIAVPSKLRRHHAHRCVRHWE